MVRKQTAPKLSILKLCCMSKMAQWCAWRPRGQGSLSGPVCLHRCVPVISPSGYLDCSHGNPGLPKAQTQMLPG